MFLSQLKLESFKNLPTVNMQFDRYINCICGANGLGKTNVLDAIFFLSFSKSFIQSSDYQSINFEQEYFRIVGEFINEQQEKFKVECGVQKDTKKLFKVNGSEYAKLADHIGLIPLVLIEPDDTSIIKEGSEERRRFFDSAISQSNKGYLQDLMKYNYLLKQRNALLKSEKLKSQIMQLIEPYDEQMIELGIKIGQERNIFLKSFLPFFVEKYNFLTENSEVVEIIYQTKVLNTDFRAQFAASLERDIMFQRTTMGIHTDDFDFIFNNNLVKKYASQGQQKSFVVALKLALFHILKYNKSSNPILLLDDIFDKLDNFRIEKLLKLVETDTFEQIIITDARPDRCIEILKKINRKVNFIYLEKDLLGKTKILEN